MQMTRANSLEEDMYRHMLSDTFDFLGTGHGLGYIFQSSTYRNPAIPHFPIHASRKMLGPIGDRSTEQRYESMHLPAVNTFFSKLSIAR
mmetsp:Transcript_22154/g.47926  ORF Transcript_22154/g.47926 Transcript_22154/m.47926 type:complete len:89 (-) Transcript_22154:661-927(-)